MLEVLSNASSANKQNNQTIRTGIRQVPDPVRLLLLLLPHLLPRPHHAHDLPEDPQRVHDEGHGDRLQPVPPRRLEGPLDGGDRQAGLAQLRLHGLPGQGPGGAGPGAVRLDGVGGGDRGERAEPDRVAVHLHDDAEGLQHEAREGGGGLRELVGLEGSK